MTRFGRWTRNLVILMMPVIAGCIGPPVTDERDVASVESAITEDDGHCLQVMLRGYMECATLVCPAAQEDPFGRPGFVGLPRRLPGSEICELCREEASTLYEECRQNELLPPGARPRSTTVPQWHEPDYRIEVHAAPTPGECVNCGWMAR